jgi:hypothetical protein
VKFTCYNHFYILLIYCDINWKSKFIYRWDIGATDQLPEYMKVCYSALLDIYNEMDKKIGEGRSYRVKYARAAVSIIYTN